MSRRRDEHNLKKVTLNLAEGDFERMGLLYPELGASKAIRVLIRGHVKSKAREAPTPKLEEDLLPEEPQHEQ